jgi:4-hydroxybenzoate polyprenyltransferase
MFRNLVKKIGEYPLTFETWLLSALGIIFIRIFLEQYSNNLAGHFVLIDVPTIVQYAASFMTILLSSTAVLLYFTKKSLREVSALALFAFTIILTAPLFDLILSAGKGYKIYYLFLNIRDLALAFISEFWSTVPNGMTFGIRIEIALVIIASFFLIYISTKNAVRSVVGALLIWFSIFLVDCLPSFLGIFQSGSIPHFIQQSILSSNIIVNSTFSLSSGFERLYDIGFDSLMTQANIIIALFALILICIFGYREKAKIMLGNIRPERILHYALLVVGGAILGGGRYFFYSWVNDLSLLTTMLAFAAAWISAVCINDINDKEIDAISNQYRPLPQGSFSDSEFYVLARIFLIIALVSAYAASLYGLFFVILFSFVFYLYSSGPMRLKRHFVSGALVIGIASISAILSGFFLSIQSRELFSFPPLLVITLIVLFGFSSMVKDIKDYAGDYSNGIRTLPVVVGLKASKIIIATIISFSILGISIYLHNWLLIAASAIASLLIWIILLAKNYKETYFFIVYLVYLAVCMIVFLMR